MERHYLTNEAARMLRLAPDAVRRLILSGKLRAVRRGKGGQYLIPQSAIDEFLEPAGGVHLPSQREMERRHREALAECARNGVRI